ncbi:MAG: hypothetical protein HC905_20280 [Bacteroidales bacterium]|nr:hypothetical protein [Bacteroidales bacterium]
MVSQNALQARTIIVLTFSLGLMSSCTNEPQGIETLDPVCFESQILPLIQNSCATSGCHDAGTKEEGYDFSNYENILTAVQPGNARQSKLYQVLTDVYGEMMPPHQPLSIDDRNLIKIWIEQGAENTTCDNNPGVPGQNENADTVCFNLDILPLLSSSCATAGCHDATTAEEGYVLTNYANIMKLVKSGNHQDSKLYKVLIDKGDDRMPPAPANALNQEQIARIVKWIDSGAPNSNCSLTICDTSGTISFISQVWPVIQNNCLGCHPATGSGNGISLGNYSQIKTVASLTQNSYSLLSGVINQKSGFKAMPQSGKLDNCKIAIVDKWISQGMVNN